ncbi:MAG: hypothetical protein CBD51_003055 [Flavobacteriales bacterium TMED191]|nr:MAG: hypothetical protein CBD51_003055 [Flavobacteriales bacterium TMED191]|tara:strand:+ start:5277 stop:5684 length:408 start_codon:yes stop_codon:yes gene_type:complete
MNEIQIYSLMMFFAGVVLTKAVFFFDEQRKKRRFYLTMSAAVLQVLDSVYTVHAAAAEYSANEKFKIKIDEESTHQEYLEKEMQKVNILMEVYTLLFLKAIPAYGRQYVNYRSWPEAQSLIQKIRRLSEDEKGER